MPREQGSLPFRRQARHSGDGNGSLDEGKRKLYPAAVEDVGELITTPCDSLVGHIILPSIHVRRTRGDKDKTRGRKEINQKAGYYYQVR
jgi:hypothetical protein